MIRVVLVDDQQLVRAGIRSLLDRAGDIEVVAEAEDGASALQAVRDTRPDVVLMDIRMPGIDGLQATEAIVADDSLRHVKVVVLTTFDTDEYVFEAVRIGASGFLVKDADPDELRRAVRVVARGDALLSPSVTRRVMQSLARAPRPRDRDESPLRHLTGRELEVLTEVGRGATNHEIAATLFMSPATARTHVSRIMAKLHARDRVQLVVTAYEAGLVRTGD